MKVVHSTNGNEPYRHIFGFYAENESAADMEDFTYKIMDWCSENIGPEFERWYLMSNMLITLIYFNEDKAATFFKLCNS